MLQNATLQWTRGAMDQFAEPLLDDTVQNDCVVQEPHDSTVLEDPCKSDDRKAGAWHSHTLADSASHLPFWLFFLDVPLICKSTAGFSVERLVAFRLPRWCFEGGTVWRWFFEDVAPLRRLLRRA